MFVVDCFSWEDEDYYSNKTEGNWGTAQNNQYENFEVRWREPGYSTPPGGGRSEHPAGYRVRKCVQMQNVIWITCYFK